MTRRALPLFLLLIVIAARATAQAPGLEREVTPGTTAPSGGAALALGGGAEGFLSVWRSDQVRTPLMRRYDRSGRPIDDVGVALPIRFSYFISVGWTGRDYLLAGIYDGKVSFVRVRTDGTLVDTDPRVLANSTSYDVGSITLAGGTILVTWETQTGLTQTLHGVLLSPELDILASPFVIATRDVTGSLSYPRDFSASVATDGRSFLVVWENHLQPQTPIVREVALDGEVLARSPLTFETPLRRPRLVADSLGYVLLWHDASAIRGVRLNADGNPQAPVRDLVSAAIETFSATAAAGEIGVVWSTHSDEYCSIPSQPWERIEAQRFDSTLRPITPPAVIEHPAVNGLASPAIATTGSEMMVGWSSATCGGRPQARALAVIDGRVETVTRMIGPSTQLRPSAATDGTSVLAVWSERRGNDPLTQIHGALVDANGVVFDSGIQVSRSEWGAEAAQVGWGGGRYLVIWTEAPGVYGQFVDRQGKLERTPFLITEDRAYPRVVWDGAEFTVVWTFETALRSARVSLAGTVRGGPEMRVAGAVRLGGAVAGPGSEVGVVYRFEDTERHEIRVATLSSRWSALHTVRRTTRPCRSLHCPAYFPQAIGWTGERYVAMWLRTDHPGYGTHVETAVPGQQERQVFYVAYATLQPADSSADMRWTGSEFATVVRLTGLAASWQQVATFRLDAHGEALAAGTWVMLASTESASPPAIAVVDSGHVLAFYDRLSDLTQRVFVRSLSSIPAPPRRRSIAKP